ncbi:hypothetical protein ACGF0D_25630 [Kitasatospora sp. NPDC048298]|uniref:hypothetical protein n=1 Tax=Kitasatospora sp. NPDC048298 TaxID=3364049 RepID=UPI00371A0424
MDTAFGALIGAVVGSVTTGGAAFASGWFQREGTRVAARAEHRKERRQGRQDSYRTFLTTSVDLVAIARQQCRNARIGDEFDTELMNSVAHALTEAWIDVSLYGPQEVTMRAAAVMEALGRLMAGSAFVAESMDVTNAFPEDINNFDRTTQEFMYAAQLALDDDGSQRLRKWPARR